MSNGVLRLSGAFQRFWQREAGRGGRAHPMGVRDIVNEIALLPAAPQAHLTLQVEAALRRWLGSDSRIISVGAAKGGDASWRGTRVRHACEIERAVSSIPGITRIDNQMQDA